MYLILLITHKVRRHMQIKHYYHVLIGDQSRIYQLVLSITSDKARGIIAFHGMIDPHTLKSSGVTNFSSSIGMEFNKRTALVTHSFTICMDHLNDPNDAFHCCWLYRHDIH